MKYQSLCLLALLIPFLHTSAAEPLTLEERVTAMENRVDIFRFSGILINRYDHVKTDGVKDLNPMRIYAALNADANVNPRLNFYSRFAMSKFMNSIEEQRTTSTGSSLNASRQEGGPTLYVERAFLNYKILPTLGLSIGRLPTSDGPPYQLYDDLPRQGTYPMLAYSAHLDGAALTYNFSNLLPEDQKLTLRAVVSPLTANAMDSNDSVKVPRLSGSYTSTTSPAYDSTRPLWAFMAEFEKTNLGFAEYMRTIIQFVTAPGLQVGDLFPRGTDVGVLSATNGIPTATGVTFQGSTLVFDIKTLTLYQELNDIAHSGVTLGITYFRSMNSSTGLSENNPLITAAGVRGTGFMSDASASSNVGNAALVTASWHLPLAGLNHPILGAEFFRATRYHQFFNVSTDDVTGIYNTRGNAYHAWYTQPLTEGLKWRLGYTVQKHEFTKGFLGEPMPSRFTEKTVYTQLRLDI